MEEEEADAALSSFQQLTIDTSSSSSSLLPDSIIINTATINSRTPGTGGSSPFSPSITPMSTPRELIPQGPLPYGMYICG
jgi:hypothetical protein